MQNKQEQGVNQQISEKPAPKTSEDFEKGPKKKRCRLTRGKPKHQHSWRKWLPEICSTPTGRVCRHHHNCLRCRKPDFCFSCALPRLLSSHKYSLSSGLPVYWSLPRVMWPRFCLNTAKLCTVSQSPSLDMVLGIPKSLLSKFNVPNTETIWTGNIQPRPTSKMSLLPSF